MQSRSAAGRVKRRFRLFSCNRAHGERGTTLVEFSILAIPFLLLIFGIMEVGFIFWGTYELENATEDAARQIRTGQVDANKIDADGFKSLVCQNVSLLARCTTKLRLDVRSFTSFSQLAANQPAPLDANGNLQNNFSWDPGGPSSIVLVSTFYEWPLINVLTSASLSNMGDGNRLLWASAAFKNEVW